MRTVGYKLLPVIVTDRNRDGLASRLAGERDRPLTINSYEMIFHADGGEVEWLSYKNEMSGMTTSFRDRKSTTDYYVGYGGGEALPPGKYRLGTLAVRVVAGSPSITFAPFSAMRATLHTSFGSRYPGRDDDYTLKLAGVSGAATAGSANSRTRT